MREIKMVDLKGQLVHIRDEVDHEIQRVLNEGNYIQGPIVAEFENQLGSYLECNHVISCGNGTDALQIALMSLDLNPGDEVVVPSFTYISAIEVIVLLGLIPVIVDVHPLTFNIDSDKIEAVLGHKTKAIIAVHLFGQLAEMGNIMKIAIKNSLYVIEDNAQSLGAKSLISKQYGGTIGHIGCTSFFPTKVLGAMGDGGAIFSNEDELAEKIRMIAKHGQRQKYYHELVGINSRLDTLQAAILRVKLKYLNRYKKQRREVAAFYDSALERVGYLEIPHRSAHSDHVFHQYTLRIKDGKRDKLQQYLSEKSIPSAIYYPLVANKQKAYLEYYDHTEPMPIAESLTKEVLSLPMHTELEEEQQNYICGVLKAF
jgi:UDP-2-acetamido-2-deoxy-ribo-hexuluronate aminotransferase